MPDGSKRIQLLAAFGASAALLVVSATTSATAQDASAAAPTRCPKGSVPAVIDPKGSPHLIGGERTCLRRGQSCKRALDLQYRRHGLHCHEGARLTAFFSRKVDVGGFRLAITCRGIGSPTVVLESGGGWGASAWFLIEPWVAKTTRVCSYDRAGLEESDDRLPPGPETAAKIVEELHSLLAGAGISPPYVLGGWSLGGVLTRMYTKRYPAEVVGLVSVDATPWGLPGEPFLEPPAIGLWAEAAAELAASPDLGTRPLVVLFAKVWPDAWVKWDKQIALLSTSSILIRADGAGHAIQIDAPRLTGEAFRLVIKAVRRNAPLPACAATRLPDLDATCLDPTSR